MTRSFSIYLDWLRFGAAFAVLLSHFAYPRFTEGRWLWIREWNLGSDAVVLFFVLSGLVIAFVAETKDPVLRQFAFNRATRIFSVALPALLFGFVLDRWGAMGHPGFYQQPFYNPLGLGEQLLIGLSMSNEWALSQVRLGSNGPYWSLSYEVAYYALFAVAWYLKGALRACLLVFMCLIFGINVLLLLPAWLMGVWVWRQISDQPALPPGRALAYTLLPPLAYGAAQLMGLPRLLSELTYKALGAEAFFALRFSDEFLWNNLMAFGFALHLLGVAALLRQRQKETKAGIISWLAGGSFSLYLFHYPLLQWLAPTLPLTGFSGLDDMILLGLCVGLCLLFAQVFERTLKAQRLWIAQFALTKKKAPSL